MASPAQLVETISRVTGVPLPTMVDIDRRLVKGKLRPKTGRGRNVARMTALDAARLLTAVLASPLANAAAEAVIHYTATRVDQARSSDQLFGAAALDDLAALSGKHGFVEALAALITSAATGSLARLVAEGGNEATPRIEVFAFTRAIRGRIRIARLQSGLTASVEYHPAPLVGSASTCDRVARAETVSIRDQHPGDLEQSRRVTERTVLAIARLLAEEGGNGRR